MSADAVKQPVDVLHTVNLVTQCLCIPIVTIFVAMRLSIRIRYRQFSILEDGTYWPIALHGRNANISSVMSHRMGKLLDDLPFEIF
jgi:hypothetical protein